MKTWPSDKERHQDYTEAQQTSGTAGAPARIRKKDRLKDFCPPLLTIPPEIFAQILRNLSRNSLLALSDTCHGFKYNHMVIRDLFTEPICLADFPLNLFELRYDTGVLDGQEGYSWGFAEDIRRDFSGLCDDVLSQKGRRDTRDEKYVTSHTISTIGRKLNAKLGSYVKRLVIPDFLTITDILPYAKHCHNIEFLDLMSLMHPIDHPEPKSKSENPSIEHPFELRWDELLEDDCKDLFLNVRSIKVECLGEGSDFDDGWNLENLAGLLGQTRNLKCLHIHSPPLYRRGSTWNGPEFAFALADVLATSAPKGLTELQLDGMFHNIRNYHTFLNELEEALPQLRDISISIDQDLQMLGLDIVDESRYIWDENPDPASDDLIRETPSTCWEYIRMLKGICDDPRWTSSLKCLKADKIYEINPRAFFSVKDNQRSKDAFPGGEIFSWFSQTLQWTPTFNWYDQMHDIKTMEWSHNSLRNMTSDIRRQELDLCRELFQDLKSSGIPVKLMLATTPWYDRSQYGDTGTFYTRTYRCIKRNNAPEEEECGLKEFLESGPGQWYLDWNGDLVDELTVKWGNNFLQEPVNCYEDNVLIPCNHRAQFDKRPHTERAEEEKEKMQPLWTDLAQTFPNLKRLNLHIPDYLYLGDETMICLLPESEWKLDVGKNKTMVVKDHRRKDGIKRGREVAFFDRKFDRVAQSTYPHRSLPLR